MPHPKPNSFWTAFIHYHLATSSAKKGLGNTSQMVGHTCVSWLFPIMFSLDTRLPFRDIIGLGDLCQIPLSSNYRQGSVPRLKEGLKGLVVLVPADKKMHFTWSPSSWSTHFGGAIQTVNGMSYSAIAPREGPKPRMKTQRQDQPNCFLRLHREGDMEFGFPKHG